MIASRVYATQQSRIRRNLDTSRTVIELGSAPLAGYAATTLFHQPNPQVSIVLWSVIALVSWAAFRIGSLNAHDRASLALASPLFTIIVALTAGLATGRPLLPPEFLMTAAALWGTAILTTRTVVRHSAPPLVVAVLPGCVPLPPTPPRLRYVSLDDPHPPTLPHLDALLVGDTDRLGKDWLAFVQHAGNIGIPIMTPGQMDEEYNGRVSIDDPHGLQIDTWRSRSTYIALKRLLDTAVIVLALPLIVPVVTLIALIVLLDGGRPVLFHQVRIGTLGRTFTMYKFRTMRSDAEVQGAAYATNGDPRITRTGRWLRKYRLDELPQLWNVLKGDMSLIGPRPEQEAFARQYEQELSLYGVRHWVRPGLSGWAQVRHGYAAGSEQTYEKLRYDIYYVKHFSPLIDLRVFVMTIWTILTGFGAR